MSCEDTFAAAAVFACFGLVIFGSIATGIMFHQSASESSHFSGGFHKYRGTIFKKQVYRVSTDYGYVYLPKLNYHYGGNETVYTDVNGTVHVSFTGGHTCRMFPRCTTCSRYKSKANHWLDKHGYIGKSNTIYHKPGFKIDLYGSGHMSTCMYEGFLQQNFDAAITLYSVTGFLMLPCLCVTMGVLLYLFTCGYCSFFGKEPARNPVSGSDQNYQTSESLQPLCECGESAE